MNILPFHRVQKLFWHFNILWNTLISRKGYTSSSIIFQCFDGKFPSQHIKIFAYQMKRKKFINHNIISSQTSIVVYRHSAVCHARNKSHPLFSAVIWDIHAHIGDKKFPRFSLVFFLFQLWKMSFFIFFSSRSNILATRRIAFFYQHQMRSLLIFSLPFTETYTIFILDVTKNEFFSMTKNLHFFSPPQMHGKSKLNQTGRVASGC